MARTGRRPGNQDTREAILAAARQAFAEKGFDAASIRTIAAAAGVDPALVHHYFGTKDQLFLDALQVPFDPSMVLTHILAGGPEGVGERLVRTLVTVWDSAAGGPAAALVRSAISNESIARMIRDFVVRRILRSAAKDLDLDPAEAPIRANLLATQISGLILVRYILRFEPLASTPPDDVVALIAPTVQRYLTGPLPTAGGNSTGGNSSMKPPPAEAATPAPASGRRRVAPDGEATTPPRPVRAAAPSRRPGPA